jgi:AcrR family transcriptional regulator
MTSQFFNMKKIVDKKLERKKILEAVTKQDILDAAIKIVIRDGIQGLTMDKVAIEASVAKGTLYVYFKNKDQILEAAIDTCIEPLVNKLFAMLDSDLAPDRKMEKYALYNLQYFDDHKDLFRVLLYDRERTDSQQKHYHTDRYLHSIKKIARILEDGVQSGLFNHLNSTKVAAMFIEANIALIVQRLSSENFSNIEEDVRLIMSIFMTGMASEGRS